MSKVERVTKKASDEQLLPIPATSVAEAARASASSAFDIKGVITQTNDELRSVLAIVLEDA